MKRWTVVIMLVLAIGAVSGARAQSAKWQFSLFDAIQSGKPGDTLVYSGRIINNTGKDLTLTGASLDFTSEIADTVYELDFTDRFLSTNGVISTAGYSGSLFYLKWLDTAARGLTGNGTITLSTASPVNPLSITQTFTAATFAPIPETSELLAWSFLGILFGADLRRRFLRRLTR